MMQTLWATVRQGKIELLELTDLPEGVRVLVTLLPENELTQTNSSENKAVKAKASEEDSLFWQQASQTSLDAVWDNTEDDVYAQLL
ncbi:MAG: hypothetical protein AAFQ95_00685 [Cyanobacteria bacterium J06621_3]